MKLLYHDYNCKKKIKMKISEGFEIWLQIKIWSKDSIKELRKYSNVTMSLLF